MKISIVIISIILTLSVFLPFFLFVFNGTHNTTKTKKYINLLLKDNQIVYGLKEIWRKNFIGISADNKILTYIHANQENPLIKNIYLQDLKHVNVIKNYNKDNDSVVRLKNLSLELVYKISANPNFTIQFFNIDDDLSEDYELQRIEKWHERIMNAIPKQPRYKIAS